MKEKDFNNVEKMYIRELDMCGQSCKCSLCKEKKYKCMYSVSVKFNQKLHKGPWFYLVCKECFSQWFFKIWGYDDL